MAVIFVLPIVQLLLQAVRPFRYTCRVASALLFNLRNTSELPKLPSILCAGLETLSLHLSLVATLFVCAAQARN